MNAGLRPLLLLLLVTALVAMGCKAHQERRWTERSTRMQACRARWERLPQQTVDTLRVIYFQRTFRFDLAHYPNFAIGTTTRGDTIGFVDRSLADTADVGDLLIIGPAPWTTADMDSILPADQVFEKDKLNALYCAVRQLRYGRMTLSPPR